MRLANILGRSTIVSDDGLIDVARASNGAFSTSVDRNIAQLDKLRGWYRSPYPMSPRRCRPATSTAILASGPVVVTPQQIFAVGLNYRHHAEEMGLTLPSVPMIFTKFVSSLCGPNDELPIPSETTDFEAELVVVIGASARDLTDDEGLSVVAATASDRIFPSARYRCAVIPPSFLWASRTATSRYWALVDDGGRDCQPQRASAFAAASTASRTKIPIPATRSSRWRKL